MYQKKIFPPILAMLLVQLALVQTSSNKVNGNIYCLLQTLMKRGYELVSGGTDNHLVLVNLKPKVNERLFFFFH